MLHWLCSSDRVRNGYSRRCSQSSSPVTAVVPQGKTPLARYHICHTVILVQIHLSPRDAQFRDMIDLDPLYPQTRARHPDSSMPVRFVGEV